MLRGWVNCNLPFGPSTKMVPSSKRTFTPAGKITGCLPIRDIAQSLFAASGFALLPHGTKQLTAEPLRPRAPVADHTLARAQNANTQPVQHRLQLSAVAVQPPARLARAVDGPDHALALQPVLHENPQHDLRHRHIRLRLKRRLPVLVGPDAAHLVVQDEAFFLEHLRYGDLELAGLHVPA